jgi:putative ABC transport system permease protein
MWSWLHRALSRLPFVAARRRYDADAASELETHVAMLTERYERAGLPPGEARIAARRQLGNLTQVREEIYRMNSIGWLGATGMDLRYAVRMVTRNPGFSAVAIATLALGIGANTAIVNVAYAVLLKPLPYAHPGELYSAQIVIPERQAQFASIPASVQAFQAWRDAPTVLGGVAALRPWECTLTGDGEPERVGGARVSSNFFSLLGVPVAQGRGFSVEEEREGHERVVVISDALWRRRYAADRGLVGQSITINGAPHLVVGIAPPSLLVPTGSHLHAQVPFAPRVDIWKPIAPTKAELAGESWDHGVLVRVPAGSSVEQGRQQLEASLQALIREHAPGATTKPLVELVPAREIYAGRFRLRLLLILGASVLLLLTACVSLANLLLARAATRTTEFATRIALGAGRTRLVSVTLVEALLLTTISGLAGVGLAYAGARAMQAVLGDGLLPLGGVTIDAPMLLIASSTSLVTALACGAFPAWQAYRAAPASQLHDAGRTSVGGRRADRTRRALVGLEMALATALVASAALLLHSFIKVMNADRGYEIEGLLTADLSLSGARYAPAPARTLFYQQLTDRVRALPSVRAAGAVSDLPAVAAETGASRTIFHPDDRDFQRLVMMRPVAMIRAVTTGYFAASGTPLRAGRLLASEEPIEVAVISQSLAARLWPSEGALDIIGHQFRQGRVDGPLITVVGLVGDARPGAVERDAPPVIYRPYEQWSSGSMTLLVRGDGDPAALAPAVRTVVRGMDPNLPILSLRTMREVVASAVAERRLQMILTSMFAAVALLLGSIGLYGVVSHAVACRTREIGLRLALGSPRARVMRSVFAHGLPPVAAGLVAGVLSAVAAATALRSLLFGIVPLDPLSFAAVAVVLLLTSALACYVPARRAASLDPLTALRHE